MIFGTLKDAINKLYKLQKRFAKWRLSFVKNGFKKLKFLSKTLWFVHFRPYDLVQILPACGLNMYKIMYERFYSSSVSVWNGSTEEFWLQIYCKNSFSVTITAADIESLKAFPTLFDKYLNHFWERVDAILEDVAVTKTISWC